MAKDLVAVWWAVGIAVAGIIIAISWSYILSEKLSKLLKINEESGQENQKIKKENEDLRRKFTEVERFIDQKIDARIANQVGKEIVGLSEENRKIIQDKLVNIYLSVLSGPDSDEKTEIIKRFSDITVSEFNSMDPATKSVLCEKTLKVIGDKIDEAIEELIDEEDDTWYEIKNKIVLGNSLIR